MLPAGWEVCNHGNHLTMRSNAKLIWKVYYVEQGLKMYTHASVALVTVHHCYFLHCIVGYLCLLVLTFPLEIVGISHTIDFILTDYLSVWNTLLA